MFLVVFVLMAVQFQSVNTLRCMMEDKKKLFDQFTSRPCLFQIRFDEPFPDAKTLKDKHNCETENFALTSILGTPELSCFASVTLDYSLKTMQMQFNGVGLSAKLDPYDHMLALYPTEELVTQYKIRGDFDTNTVELTVRVQCRMGDDCALNALVALLPRILQPTQQLEIFENINQVLNQLDTSIPRLSVT